MNITLCDRNNALIEAWRQAIILETGDKRVPWLISAPTMRVPMDFNIGTSVNAYLAMKAILIKAKNHPAINSI